MAPVSHYQSRQIVLPPRPAKGPPGGARTVHSLISLKTFLMLLLGSFCIFILAVFIWKFGAFLRSFSRGKVISGGKAATVRYAKTWHGWVPRAKHDNRRRIRTERLNRFRDKLAWRTSHADYSWVWWDPGGRKFHQHRRNQQRLRIVPPQLLSYRFKGPDVHQPCPVVPSSRSHSQDSEKRKHSHHASIYSYLTARGSAWYKSTAQEKKQLPTHLADSGLEQVNFDDKNSNHFPKGIWVCAKRRLNALLPPLPFAYTISSPGNAVIRSRSLPDGGLGDSCAPRPLDTPIPRRSASEGQGGEDLRPRFFASNLNSQDISPPSAIWPKTNSWRFKAWGAKMQRGAFGFTPIHFRGFAGRPGTPVSGVLKGMVSSATYSGLTRHTVQSIHQTKLNDTQTASDAPKDRAAQEKAVNDGTFDDNLDADPKAYRPRPSRVTRSSSVQDIRRSQGENERPFLRRHLSNPEICLIDDLNRKLDWLCSELDPGRKPYHFSVCHNHWLNRATWVVLDPVSRASLKTRRLYGDPRVNYPSPQAKEKQPMTENPTAAKTKVLMPNLDSWRLAVNGARKTAGAMEFLDITKLFDSSAEEIQDGAIDPASWVLKKPPQGYSLTRKQKNAYFEGCGGWCETLDDWQQVPRAYRARRVILEGKANRRRMAEVANAVGGNCKKAARKITPIWASSAKDEKRTERRERSGRGFIKKRMKDSILVS